MLSLVPALTHPGCEQVLDAIRLFIVFNAAGVFLFFFLNVCVSKCICR